MTRPTARSTDRHFNSADGIRLHYRDYDGDRDRPPILCLPGLTRNARDFEPIGELHGGDWRVIALDLRGRGGSGHDPDPANYRPAVYVADVIKLLDQLGIADAVFIGTSLGGLCTMVLASIEEERVAGALINDIGPVIEPAGLERIGGYVGSAAAFADWAEVTALLRTRNGDVYPDWDAAAWDRFARRLAREDGGTIRFDYDPRLADGFFASLKAPSIDLWPLWRALAGRPVTLLRGELTDLLTADVAERMAREFDGVELVTVPRVGHPPTLEEPESMAALDRLLDRVKARL